MDGDQDTDASRHQRLLAATVPLLAPGAAVSHSSAAVLHELPHWADELDRVHITRSRSRGGKVRSLVHVHVAPLGAGDTEVVDGVTRTTLARTVADLGRTLPYDKAVAVGDAAFRTGLDGPPLDQVLQRMDHWPGVRSARRAAAFLDGRSESVGESISRVRLAQDGLPAPDLQRRIVDAAGRVVARVDFCWEEQRTIGEFDGKVKYGELVKPGQTSADVLFDEKRREDALRDLGWQVVRWVWADLYQSGVIRERLLRAFARTAAAQPRTP